VTRPTVYAHFPDARSLLQACSGHVRASVPPPDPTRWHSLTDPRERLETALGALYGYYERLEPLLENVQRDATVMPLVAEMNAYRTRYLDETRELLLQAWAATRGGARTRLRRVIGHALEFGTWQSLVRHQGCTSGEAAQLMVALACAIGSSDATAKAKARA
jgi:AcrR family transcriptional regulator